VKRLPLLLFALFAFACEDEPSPEPSTQLLARADNWIPVDTSADLFPPADPEGVVCDPSGYAVEDLGVTFEVNTDLCNAITVHQPTLVALAPGDVIDIQVVHEELEAPEPAEARLGLAVDGMIVWEATVPIPGEPGMVEGSITLDRAISSGADLQYHVENHGANSWALSPLTATIVQ